MTGACRHRGRLLLKLAMALDKIGEDPYPYRLGMVYPSAQRANQIYLALEPEMRGRWKLSAWLVRRASVSNRDSERGIANVKIFMRSRSRQDMSMRVLLCRSSTSLRTLQRHGIVWPRARLPGWLQTPRHTLLPANASHFKGLFTADA